MYLSKSRDDDMEFVELTEKEYRKFWENHPLKTFLSATEKISFASINKVDAALLCLRSIIYITFL